MELKTLIILYGDTCCNSRSHPHKNQYNYTTDILHFYFLAKWNWKLPISEAYHRRQSFWVFGCFVFDLGCFVFEFWGLRFRVLGSSFSRFRGLRFRSRVLRFRVLGASFSRFGCFVLRSSFSSVSFSKLPIQFTVIIRASDHF